MFAFILFFNLFSLSPPSSFLEWDQWICNLPHTDPSFTHEMRHLKNHIFSEKLRQKQWSSCNNKLPYNLDLLLPHVNELEYGRSLIHAVVGRYIEESPSTLKQRHERQQQLKNLFLKKLKRLVHFCQTNLDFPTMYGSMLAVASSSIKENQHTLFALEELLNLGADPNSPLNACKLVSYEEATQIHGFVLDLANDQRSSPLELAINKENYKSAMMLIQYGADINEVIEEGNSILMHFIKKISQKKSFEPHESSLISSLLELMLKQPIDISHQNLMGDTIFHLLHHPTFNYGFKLEAKTQILKTLNVYLEKSDLSLLQNINGQYIDGHFSPYPTSLLEEDLHYKNFGSKNGLELPPLLDHLERLPNSLSVLLCLSRVCPSFENPKNELRQHFLIQTTRDILYQRLLDENPSPIHFLQSYLALKIPYDYLILFALSFVQDDNPLSSFFRKILWLINQKKEALGLSEKSLMWLQLYDFSQQTHFFDIEKIVDLIVQKKRYVYPLILVLSPFNAMTVFQKLSQVHYLSSSYNPRDVIPRMIELALYRQMSRDDLNFKKHEKHQEHIQEIRTLFQTMTQNIPTLDRPEEMIFPDPQTKLPYIVKGRSIVISFGNKQYSLKLKKKNETDDQFLDGAVINWGLSQQDAVIQRQFEPSSYVKLSDSLFQELSASILNQKEFQDVELSPFACVIVTQHTQYYDYLFQPNPNKNTSDDPQHVRDDKLAGFLNGLEQNMRDYSSLAHKGLFLNEISSNSHGENRSYDYATYLNRSDIWNHGAGTFEDLTYGCHISNLSTQGLRDLGNLLFIDEDKIGARYTPSNKQLYEQLSFERKQSVALSEYSKVYIEHLFVHTVMFFCFLEHNRLILSDLTDESFYHLLTQHVITPFLEEHFQKEMPNEEYENLKKHVCFFMKNLILQDWHFFQNNPACIYAVISRESARDFPLQNIFTGIARITALLNLKEFNLLDPSFLWHQPQPTVRLPRLRKNEVFEKKHTLCTNITTCLLLDTPPSPHDLASYIEILHREEQIWINYCCRHNIDFIHFFKNLEKHIQTIDSSKRLHFIHINRELLHLNKVSIYQSVLLFYMRSQQITPFKSLLEHIVGLNIHKKVLDMNFLEENIFIFDGIFFSLYIPYFDSSLLDYAFQHKLSLDQPFQKLSSEDDYLALFNLFFQYNNEHQPTLFSQLLLLFEPDVRRTILNLPQTITYLKGSPLEVLALLDDYPDLKCFYYTDIINHLRQGSDLQSDYSFNKVLNDPVFKDIYINAICVRYKGKTIPEDSYLLQLMKLSGDFRLFYDDFPCLVNNIFSKNTFQPLVSFLCNYPTLEAFYFVLKSFPNRIYQEFNTFEYSHLVCNLTLEQKRIFLEDLKTRNINPFYKASDFPHYISPHIPSFEEVQYIVDHFFTQKQTEDHYLDLLNDFHFNQTSSVTYPDEHLLFLKKAFTGSNDVIQFFSKIVSKLHSLKSDSDRDLTPQAIDQRFYFLLTQLLPQLDTQTATLLSGQIINYLFIHSPSSLKELWNPDFAIFPLLNALQSSNKEALIMEFTIKVAHRELKDYSHLDTDNRLTRLTDQLMEYIQNNWACVQPYLSQSLGSKKKGWFQFISTLYQQNIHIETVAQPHLEKFFAFSTFSMLPRKPHIAKDMKHSSRLEEDCLLEEAPSSISKSRSMTALECFNYFILKQKIDLTSSSNNSSPSEMEVDVTCASLKIILRQKQPLYDLTVFA